MAELPRLPAPIEHGVLKWACGLSPRTSRALFGKPPTIDGQTLSTETHALLTLARWSGSEGFFAGRSVDEARAQALRLWAFARMARMKQPPSPHWFNALCAWALYADDLPAALRVRDLELATCAGRGQLAYESNCHVERCRLLARMGRPLDEVLAAGRAAAGRLREPAPALDKLERAARGEPAET